MAPNTCPTCGHRSTVRKPKTTIATMADVLAWLEPATPIASMSDAELVAERKRTAGVEDVRFALKYQLAMPDGMAERFEALTIRAVTMKRSESYIELRALQVARDAWLRNRPTLIEAIAA